MIRFARLLLPSSLLAGMAVALIGFAPFSAPDRLAELLLFEITLAAPVDGELRLEALHAEADEPPETALAAGPSGAARFVLPAGGYRAFRLFAPERAGGAKVARLRIADLFGKELASFGGEHFRTVDDGATAELTCDPPLVLRSSVTADWRQNAGLCIALTLLFALAAWRGAVPLEKLRAAALAQAGQWAKRARAHPFRTLLATAVAAVVVSCHPVIFCGQSFVSPNNGARCLYATFPTLPGAPAGPVENPKAADIGAMLWAHLPYSGIEHRAIFHDHELPLWNRASSCGVPLLGQGQSMIGDPLHWIPLAAGGAAWAWDVKFILAKILFAFGIGLLVRAAVGRLGVAVLLAASSAFLGFFAYRFNHAAFFSLSYAPWLLLAWLEIARAPGGRSAARWVGLLIAANWMELNSGTAKEASMLIGGLNAAGVLVLLAQRESWPARARKLAAAACGVLIFLLLSAPCWLVFLDSLCHAWTTYNVPRAYQIQPALLLGLFDDLFYRQTIARENHANPSANFLVLLGVLWALVNLRTLWREPAFRALAVAAVAMAALVFGVVPPGLLVRLPFVGNITHVDNTFSCVLIVLLLPLAGFGLRACHARGEAASWRGDWVTTLLLGAGLVAAFLGYVQVTTRSPSTLLPEAGPITLSGFFLGYAAALLVAGAALPWLMRRLLHERGGTLSHLLLAALALGALHFRHGMYGRTKFDPYVMNPQARVDLQARSPMIEHLRRLAPEPARVAGFGEVLTPGYAALLGLEGIAGPDALVSAYYREFVDAAKLPVVWDWRVTVRPDTTPTLRPFHDLLNLRYYLAMPSPTPPAVAGLRRIGTADLDLYESPTAWPRAFFTDSLTRYRTAADFAESVWQSDGRPLAALQDGTAWPGERPTAVTRQIVAARDYRLTSNTTTFTIEAPARGVAVLTESFEEGNYRVTVNGAPSPYVRVNHAFCGVPIPHAGRFVVRFEYWPRQLTLALWLAAAGLALLVGGGLWLRRATGTFPADSEMRACPNHHPPTTDPACGSTVRCAPPRGCVTPSPTKATASSAAATAG